MAATGDDEGGESMFEDEEPSQGEGDPSILEGMEERRIIAPVSPFPPDLQALLDGKEMGVRDALIAAYYAGRGHRDVRPAEPSTVVVAVMEETQRQLVVPTIFQYLEMAAEVNPQLDSVPKAKTKRLHDSLLASVARHHECDVSQLSQPIKQKFGTPNGLDEMVVQYLLKGPDELKAFARDVAACMASKRAVADQFAYFHTFSTMWSIVWAVTTRLEMDSAFTIQAMCLSIGDARLVATLAKDIKVSTARQDGVKVALQEYEKAIKYYASHPWMVPPFIVAGDTVLWAETQRIVSIAAPDKPHVNNAQRLASASGGGSSTSSGGGTGPVRHRQRHVSQARAQSAPYSAPKTKQPPQQLSYEEACVYCRDAETDGEKQRPALLNHTTADCTNKTRQRIFREKHNQATPTGQAAPTGGTPGTQGHARGGSRGGRGGRGGFRGGRGRGRGGRGGGKNEKQSDEQYMTPVDRMGAEKEEENPHSEVRDYFDKENEVQNFAHESEYLAAMIHKSPRTVCADVAGIPTHIALDTQASANLISETLIVSLIKRGAKVDMFTKSTNIYLADGKTSMRVNKAVDVNITLQSLDNTQVKSFMAYCYVVKDLFVPMILSSQTCKDHALIQYEPSLVWYVDTPTPEDALYMIDTEEWLSGGLFDTEAMPRVAESLTMRDAFIRKLVENKDIVRDPTFPPAAHMPPVVIDPVPGLRMRPTRPRTFPVKKLAALRKQIKTLLDMGFIKRLTVPVESAAQVVMVLKKGKEGSEPDYRMALDFTSTLNLIARKVQGCVPDVDALVREVAGYKYYAQFDLKAAYWQIPIAEESIPLTAFMADGVIYGCTRLPTGFSEAPAIFNNWTDACFSEITGKRSDRDTVTCKYFDNIACGADTEEGLLQAISEVLEVCKKHNLTISASKTEIGFPHTIFLGHKVDAKGMSIDPTRVDSLLRIKAPKTRKQLRGILGTFNYVRKFIPNFSGITATLTPLTSEANPFVWTEEHSQALQELKDAVSKAPTLANIDYSKQIFINTDASKRAVGAVLYQLDENSSPVAIAFTSRKLASQQTRWPNWERELYAVFVAFEVWHHLISGFHVNLATDCKGIFNLTPGKISDKVARWLSVIWQQSHSMTHVKGEDNVAADCLSRQVGEKVESDDLTSITSTSKASTARLMGSSVPVSPTKSIRTPAEKQGGMTMLPSLSHTAPHPVASHEGSDMERCAAVTTRRQAGGEKGSLSAPSLPESAKKTAPEPLAPTKRQQKKSREDSTRAAEEPQEASHSASSIVPTTQMITQSLHVSESVAEHLLWAHGGTHGHWGVEKTLKILQAAGRTWTNMKKDIRAFIRECGSCQKQMLPPAPLVGEVRNLEATVPFQSWSYDIVYISSSGESDVHGHTHFLCVIDDASRFTWTVPMKGQKSEELIRALDIVLSATRAPLMIRYDSGPQNISEMVTDHLKALGITLHQTTPGRHEANSLCERVVQTIKNQAVHARSSDVDMPWCMALAKATRWYNEAPHTALKASPREICFPDPHKMLTELARQHELPPSTAQEGGRELTQALLSRLQPVLENKATTLKKRKESEKRTPTVFQADDLVLMRDDSPFGASNLRPRNLGPFRVITRKENNDTYEIQDVRDTKHPRTVHVSRLIPFSSRTTAQPATLRSLDDERWVIEEVLDHITADNKAGVRTTDLLVRWQGFPEPSWTHIGTINTKNCPPLLAYIQDKRLSWLGGCVERRSKS
jgi:hypothetical protein